jgi:hypothetical protein
MKLEKLNSSQLRFTVWQYNGVSWQPITDPSNPGLGNSRTTTFSALGGALPLGRVGFYGYWIRSGVHVDIDHFRGNW